MPKISEKLNAGLILTVYFGLKPLYLLDSGLMQLCDYFWIAALAACLARDRLTIRVSGESKRLIISFAALVVYQVLVNLIWSGVTGDVQMNRRTLYYVFNFLAFSFTIVIGERIGTENAVRYLGKGAFWSAVLVLIGLLTVDTSSSRSTGFFNNPNQLGYYGVVVLSAVILCHEKMSGFRRGFVFAVSLWAVIVSLSKAAILGYIGLTVSYIFFFQHKRTLKRVILQLILAGLFAVAIYYLLFSDSSYVLSNHTLSNMRHRILYMSQENDSNLRNGRGYGRLLELGYHYLWGTGEGAYSRFSSRYNTEVHSTYASLITCYGLIGFFWYAFVVGKCFGKPRQYYRSIPVLFGILLYSVTHNAIRNTLVWLILAVLYLVNRTEREQGVQPDGPDPLLRRNDI